MSNMSLIVSKIRKVIAKFFKNPLQYAAKPIIDRPNFITDAQKRLLYINIQESNEISKDPAHGMDFPIKKKQFQAFLQANDTVQWFHSIKSPSLLPMHMQRRKRTCRNFKGILRVGTMAREENIYCG